MFVVVVVLEGGGGGDGGILEVWKWSEGMEGGGGGKEDYEGLDGWEWQEKENEHEEKQDGMVKEDQEMWEWGIKKKGGLMEGTNEERWRKKYIEWTNEERERNQ